MKNNLIWTKTLLTVYRYLERICGAIDKIVMKSALNCGNIIGQNYHHNNVLTISQKIIDLSERKVTLINLKILIEEVLSKMDTKDARLLIEKFFDGAKSRELAEGHNLSMRTLFRKLDGAMESFASRLKMLGYNDSKIEKMLENEGWINNVYDNLSKKKEEDFTVSSLFLAKAVSM